MSTLNDKIALYNDQKQRAQKMAEQAAAAVQEQNQFAQLFKAVEQCNLAAFQHEVSLQQNFLSLPEACSLKFTAFLCFSRTPLHYAAENNAVEFAKFLLANHAPICAQDENKATPLHLASSNNSVEFAQLLIRHVQTTKKENMDHFINFADSQGCTPLHDCCGIDQD